MTADWGKEKEWISARGSTSVVPPPGKIEGGLEGVRSLSKELAMMTHCSEDIPGGRGKERKRERGNHARTCESVFFSPPKEIESGCFYSQKLGKGENEKQKVPSSIRGESRARREVGFGVDGRSAENKIGRSEKRARS